MVNGEARKLQQLEQRLSRARMDRRRAEQELNALERQAGFGGPPRKLRAVLDRSQRRVDKCRETEAELERQLDELRTPSPKAGPDEGVAAPSDPDGSGSSSTGATEQPSAAEPGDEEPV